MTELKDYPLRVFWSEDDSGYIAEAIDLPGCSAFGETQSQALDEMPDAMAAWMEAARSAGNAVPAPSAVDQPEEYSGRIGLRLPKTLHAKLAKIASIEAQSLNSQIVTALVEFQATWWASKSVVAPVVPKLEFAASARRYLVLNTAYSDRSGWIEHFDPKAIMPSGILMARCAPSISPVSEIVQPLPQSIAVPVHG